MMEGRIALRSISMAALRLWWIPALAAVVGFFAAIAYLEVATPKYRATALLGPKTGGLPSGQRLPSLGGLGGLVSVLQGGEDDNIARAEIYWKSKRLAVHFMESDERLQELMPERWNRDAAAWTPDMGFRARVRRLFYEDQAFRPTTEEVRRRLDRVFLSEVQEQKFRQLSFRSPDPARSQRLLSWIVVNTNRVFRADDLSDISKLIAFTERRIAAAGTPREQEMLAATMTLLEQQQLRTEASEIFMFEVVQPPLVEARPSEPDPVMILSAGIILPPAIAVALILLWLGGRVERVPSPVRIPAEETAGA
jgi:hypothetical protein